MKKILTTVVAATIALAPVIGFACEYNDAAMSASVQSQPQADTQASKAPAATVAKASVTKPVKQVNAKTKAPATDAKVAVATPR